MGGKAALSPRPVPEERASGHIFIVELPFNALWLIYGESEHQGGAMFRLAAPIGVLAALIASPAFAQLAPPQQQDGPGSNGGASTIEDSANWAAWGNANFDVGTACAQLSMKLKGLDAEAAAFERLNEGFGKIGDGLTLITAGSQAAQGKYDDMTQTMAEAAFDKSVCAIWPGPVCVSWSAGRMAGATIKMMPMPFDSQHRTIEEAVLDKEVQFAQWLMPSLNQPMNAENMREAFNAFQRQRTALLNARDRLRDRAGQCSNDHHGDEPDYADRKDGSARQSTSADRATGRFNDLAPAYVPPSASNDSWGGQYGGQSSGSTYSAPAQQSQSSSSSSFNWGQAFGAALTGYAIGKASNANQSSSSSKPSSTPNPPDQGCGDPDPDSPAPLGYCN
jgi:hypothetical protein